MAKRGNTGIFTPTPITLTIAGETKTYPGRGRRPKWLIEYEAANGPVTSKGRKDAKAAQAEATPAV